MGHNRDGWARRVGIHTCRAPTCAAFGLCVAANLQRRRALYRQQKAHSHAQTNTSTWHVMRGAFACRRLVWALARKAQQQCTLLSGPCRGAMWCSSNARGMLASGWVGAHHMHWANLKAPVVHHACGHEGGRRGHAPGSSAITPAACVVCACRVWDAPSLGLPKR